MSLDATQTLIESTGDVYLAPVGTPFPTDFDQPAGPWTSVGHITTEGPRPSGFDADTEKFYSWQSPKTAIRTALGQTEPQFAVDLYQVNANTLGLFFGPGTLTDDVWVPTPGAVAPEAAMVIDIFDGDRQYRWCLKRVQPSPAGEINFTSSELATFPVKFDMLAAADGSAPFEFRLPAAATATGAAAGTPGTWTPSGSTPPASVAALQAGSVVASPATAWTTGQYVQTGTSGTAGEAHWSGTAWVAGKA